MSNLEYIRGWPLPKSTGIPRILHNIQSKAVVPVVGFLSKIFLDYLTDAKVVNGQKFRDLVTNRPSDQSLITVSNHYSCCDEPLIYGVLNWSTLLRASLMRWSVSAHDVVFTEQFNSWLFGVGKGVPVIRGAGVYQRGLDFCAARLREGDWVHIFPEGKVNSEKELVNVLVLVDAVPSHPITIRIEFNIPNVFSLSTCERDVANVVQQKLAVGNWVDCRADVEIACLLACS